MHPWRLGRENHYPNHPCQRYCSVRPGKWPPEEEREEDREEGRKKGRREIWREKGRGGGDGEQGRRTKRVVNRLWGARTANKDQGRKWGEGRREGELIWVPSVPLLSLSSLFLSPSFSLCCFLHPSFSHPLSLPITYLPAPSHCEASYPESARQTSQKWIPAP